MTQLTLSYKLSGRGWADAVISCGGDRAFMSISYTSDALGDLASAVVSLFYERRGNPAICSWQDEPGEYRWVMRRDSDAVLVQIMEFDDCFSRKENEKGHLLFESECSLLRLATQVKGQMHQILNELGEDGYKERWVNNKFPMQEFTRLTGLIQEYKQSLSLKKEQTRI